MATICRRLCTVEIIALGLSSLSSDHATGRGEKRRESPRTKVRERGPKLTKRQLSKVNLFKSQLFRISLRCVHSFRNVETLWEGRQGRGGGGGGGSRCQELHRERTAPPPPAALPLPNAPTRQNPLEDWAPGVASSSSTVSSSGCRSAGEVIRANQTWPLRHLLEGGEEGAPGFRAHVAGPPVSVLVRGPWVGARGFRGGAGGWLRYLGARDHGMNLACENHAPPPRTLPGTPENAC